MARYAFTTADGTKFNFPNKAVLAEFVRKELNSLAWLGRYNHPYSGGPAINEVLAPLQHIQNTLPQESPDAAQIEAWFKQYSDFQPPLHQKSPMRRWLDPLAAKSPLRAIYAFMFMRQMAGRTDAFDAIHGGGSDWLAGIQTAMAMTEGWGAPDKAQLAEQAAESSARAADEALESAKQSKTDLEALHAAAASSEEQRAAERAAAALEMTRQADEALGKLRNSAADTLSRVETEWASFQLEVNARLALEAPATYWDTKHKRHAKWVVFLVLLALGLGAGGAWFLHEIARAIFEDIKVNQVPSWFQAITFSLTTLVYLLALRSVLRLLMSHVHLALDSAERQTMIKSYLALARKGDVKEESLDKILSTIFRPTGDGIVKDEGIPLSILTELIKSRP